MSTDSASSRRRWIKRLAATFEGTWQTEVLPRSLDGRCRVETRHTVYVFEDAECVETARRGDDSDAQGPLVGMRLVGWCVDMDGEPSLAHQWRPGARAILWRPRRAHDAESSVALTSPTFAFVRVTRDDDEPITMPGVGEVTTHSHVRPSPPSLTRVAIHP